jgi:hypothetical protein
MNKIKTQLFSLAFVGLMALFAINPASANITTTFTEPFTGTADDTACSGEFVDVTGMMGGVFTLFDDPTGGAHVNLTGYIHATGIGETTGNKYLFDIYIAQLRANANDNNAGGNVQGEEFLFTTAGTLIDTGTGGANAVIKTTLFGVVDATGNVAVQRIDISSPVTCL